MATRRKAYADLPELKNPRFDYMVAEHAFELHGHGHHLRFVPGVPVPVLNKLQPEALAHGAKRIDGKDAQVKEAEKLDPQRDPASDEYEDAVREAAQKLLNLNYPHDFGANGVPYVDAWQRELGWKPILTVREKIWQEVKDKFRQEQLAG